jgi:regulator of protease activity HflC (stomatin/prohibitin superfamily)
MRAVILLVALAASGCYTIQPGHLGLYFDSRRGLQRDVLPPGRHWTGFFGRVEDFDVTLTTHVEEIRTTSSEGLQLELRIAVIYKPVISELYQLLTEVGSNYYEEVIGPEFRSAARGIFARHSYLELLRRNEQVEDEVEVTLRRRTAGKHVQIISVTLEAIQYSPDIVRAVREKIVAEQDAARQKTLLLNQDMRRKMDLAHQAEQARMRTELTLANKQREVTLAKAQAELDKIREESEAAKKVIRAKGDADAAKLSAAAATLKNKALTPLSVAAMGYEALRALGGPNTHIMLGDWSKVPSFLFPFKATK